MHACNAFRQLCRPCARARSWQGLGSVLRMFEYQLHATDRTRRTSGRVVAEHPLPLVFD